MRSPVVRVIAIAVLAALAASAIWGGTTGFAGMAMGIVATTVTLAGWWLPISIVGKLSQSEKSKGTDGTFWVVLTFLLKLPIFFALAFSARRMGGSAEPCFLWGLGLVYLALIGWALYDGARTA